MFVIKVCLFFKYLKPYITRRKDIRLLAAYLHSSCWQSLIMSDNVMERIKNVTGASRLNFIVTLLDIYLWCFMLNLQYISLSTVYILHTGCINKDLWMLNNKEFVFKVQQYRQDLQLSPLCVSWHAKSHCVFSSSHQILWKKRQHETLTHKTQSKSFSLQSTFRVEPLKQNSMNCE